MSEKMTSGCTGLLFLLLYLIENVGDEQLMAEEEEK